MGKRCPKHLSPRSGDIWRRIVGEFSLEPDEFALLQSALEALDRADEARKTIELEGPYFRDFRNQPKPHPALQQERDGRRDYAHLIGRLPFEKDEGYSGEALPEWLEE